MLSFLLLTSLAQADTYFETFTTDPLPAGDTYLADEPGWTNGYDGDNWYCNGSAVFSNSDDNGGEIGSGGPADNWLIPTGASGEDVWFTSWMYTEDDDTMGFILHQTSAEDYYAVIVLGSEASGGGGSSNPFGLSGNGIAIVKVDGGEVDLLDSAGGRVPDETYLSMAAGFNDGEVWIKVWDTYIEDVELDTPEDAEWSVTADDDGFGGGDIGYYAYDAGDGRLKARRKPSLEHRLRDGRGRRWCR